MSSQQKTNKIIQRAILYIAGAIILYLGAVFTMHILTLVFYDDATTDDIWLTAIPTTLGV